MEYPRCYTANREPIRFTEVIRQHMRSFRQTILNFVSRIYFIDPEQILCPNFHLRVGDPAIVESEQLSASSVVSLQ